MVGKSLFTMPASVLDPTALRRLLTRLTEQVSFLSTKPVVTTLPTGATLDDVVAKLNELVEKTND